MFYGPNNLPNWENTVTVDFRYTHRVLKDGVNPVGTKHHQSVKDTMVNLGPAS